MTGAGFGTATSGAPETGRHITRVAEAGRPVTRVTENGDNR